MAFLRRFLPSMSLLCAFEAVSRHLSFTAAAEELHLTQSAVSRHIKLLEQTIGKELFVRDKRGTRLSLAGEIYAKEVRASLRDIYAATQSIKFSQDESTINLAVLPMFGSRWLAPRLPNFVARHPDILINMITKLVPFDFQFENIDLAIHYGLDDWPGAELESIMKESTVPVCKQSIAEQFHLERPADLLKAPLLHLASRADAWERWFRTHDVDPVGMRGMIFDQFSTLTQLAVSGLGIALLPHFLIEKEIDSGELVVVGDALDGLEQYYIARPKSKAASAAAMVFQEWIMSEIGR